MDNTNLEAKVALRKHFLSKIRTPKILECFAGEERSLYKSCYHGMDVTALDTKQIKGVLKIDNRDFISSQDLTGYNFFDLDAYGSPYELLLNIFYKKQKDNPFVVIITDGLSRNLNYGTGSKLIQTVIKNQSKISIPCLDRHHEFIIKLILKTFSGKYSIDCRDCKIIREDHNKMFYLGMLCIPKIPQNNPKDAINA